MNIVVRWTKMGPEFTYSIWYASQPKGPWIKDTNTRLTDDVLDILRGVRIGEYYQTVGYNEYVISGLSAGQNYSVYIKPEDRYDSWWYSQDSYNSISGGLSALHTRPVLDGGNLFNFQFLVDLSGFGGGPFGGGPFGGS